MAVKRRSDKGKRCFVCVYGNVSWSRFLVTCSDCGQLCAHPYCIGIEPGSEQDRDDAYWLCPICRPNPISDDDSVLNADAHQQYKTEIMPYQEEEPKPLCILFPEGYYSPVTAEAAEIMPGVVLVVTPSGEAIIKDEDMSFSSDDCSDSKRPSSSCNYVEQKPEESTGETSPDLKSDDVEKSNQPKPETARRRSERAGVRKLQRLNMIGVRRSPRFRRRKMLQASSRKGVAVC